MGVVREVTRGRRLAVGPVVLLLGVLAVFVLVHMGTPHDVAVTGTARAAHAHDVAGPDVGGSLDHGDDHPAGGHHDDVLVGCLVAVTGLVGSLLLRPRLLALPSRVLGSATGGGLGAVAARALRAPPATSLATLCVLRT